MVTGATAATLAVGAAARTDADPTTPVASAAAAGSGCCQRTVCSAK